MSSFISNFKSEAKVLAVVVLVLAACELGLRASIKRSSVDVRHIEEIPAIVGKRPDVLFLGNSLTRAGVIPAELGLSSVGLVHPDDTTIVDWLYLYKRHGMKPRLLVVPFHGDQLSDSTELQVDRLGYMGGAAVLAEAFRHDVRGFENRMSYVLGMLSCAYANRQRIRTQLSALLIPGYKKSAQVLNKGFDPPKERTAARTYKRLERFLDSLGHTRAVFVAVPVPQERELDPELEALLRRRGAELVDLRRVEGLTGKHFPDGYHLSPQGGALFSRALAGRLQQAAGTGR